MSDASDTWNALPQEDRMRLNGILIERQIRDIDAELERGKRAYNTWIREVTGHRNNLVRSLENWRRENGFTD